MVVQTVKKQTVCCVECLFVQQVYQQVRQFRDITKK